MNAPSAEIALSVRDLAKSFRDVKAVDGLSFDVRRGEVFGFLGPNGAGKTTTMRMMCGLLRPDAGTVAFNGAGGGPLRGETLRTIGLSPQAIVLWETLTCLEQLEFMGRTYGLARADARRRSLDLLGSFGLEDKRDRRAKTLSGGMQRRLNIALALVHEPAVLFLDEPQAGLDPQSRVLVREYLRGLARRTTIVLTTHDMEEAEKLSDRVCVIDQGRLLALGTVAEIKSRLGRGDVVEIEVAEDARTALLPHLAALGPAAGNVSLRDHTLSFVSDEASRVLPAVLGILKDRGFGLENIRVRKVTLEDVFIQLTGRGLRE